MIFITQLIYILDGQENVFDEFESLYNTERLRHSDTALQDRREEVVTQRD